jgi:hypothetical protein
VIDVVLSPLASKSNVLGIRGVTPGAGPCRRDGWALWWTSGGRRSCANLSSHGVVELTEKAMIVWICADIKVR